MTNNNSDSLSMRLGSSWDAVIAWRPAVGQRFQLRDAPQPLAVSPRKTSSYRAILERYGVEFPQSEFPEHEIFGRKSRNAAAQFGDAKLASLRAYMDLHRTIEPNRSLWSAGVARSDKQELGPTPEKLEKIWSSPGIEYETRMVGYQPHHRREMKIPTSGPVLYFGVSTNTSRENENTIRRGGCSDEYRRRFGKRLGKNRIAKKGAAMSVPSEISYEERGSAWALVDLNGLRFAPRRGQRDGEIVYIGQMLTLNDNDIDDKIRTPKKLECPGSNERFWVGTDGEHSEQSVDNLRFYANDPDLNQKHIDQMDYTDFAGLDYDFEPAGEVTPFDVLAQKQTLKVVNAMLLPRSMATFAAMNDNAQSSKDIGRALPGYEELSDKTLERRGKCAVDDAIEDIHSVIQQLAA